MTIERHYENRERFKITKNEAIYMLLVLLIILCIFIFVLPIFAEKLKSAGDAARQENGQKIVKPVRKTKSLPSKSANVKTGKAKSSTFEKQQTKYGAGKDDKKVSTDAAAVRTQPDIVFILDLSPSMMTKDDIGIRALVGMQWINQILQHSNSSRLFLLCLENKSITEYMLNSKKNVPDAVNLDF